MVKSNKQNLGQQKQNRMSQEVRIKKVFLDQWVGYFTYL